MVLKCFTTYDSGTFKVIPLDSLQLQVRFYLLCFRFYLLVAHQL